MTTKKYDDADVQHYIGVMTENIVDRFKSGFEAIDQIKLQVDKIPGIEEDIAMIKSDIKIMKRALKVTNIDVQGHDKRLTKLEGVIFNA